MESFGSSDLGCKFLFQTPEAVSTPCLDPSVNIYWWLVYMESTRDLYKVSHWCGPSEDLLVMHTFESSRTAFVWYFVCIAICGRSV